MPKHATTRVTNRQWKFILRVPADKAAATQELIRTRYIEFIKLRKEHEIKDYIVQSAVTFTPQAEEGGLAVFDGDIVLSHRTSVDYLSFPRLRTAIIATIPIPKEQIHLEEIKKPKAETKAEAKPEKVEATAEKPEEKTELKKEEKAVVKDSITEVIGKLEELKTTPAPEPPPLPKPVPTPEIGIMLPEPAPKRPTRTRVCRPVAKPTPPPPPPPAPEPVEEPLAQPPLVRQYGFRSPPVRPSKSYGFRQ